MKNADMPAMPSGAIVRSRTNRNDPGSDFFVVTETSAANMGMTKREAFAMAAMQGFLSNSKVNLMVPTDSSVVLESIKVADALLAALEVSNER
jgi:hypothetical protein